MSQLCKVVAQDTSPRSPKWLTREYVEFVLCQAAGSQVEVVEMKILPATAKDQNFSSVIFRLQILQRQNGGSTERKMSYIIKTSLENGHNEPLHRALEVYDVFTNETSMYKEVLPRLAMLLKKIGFEEQLAPDVINITSARKSILFEDLCNRSYMMKDKRIGLDALHAKLILKKVAKLHAAGAKQNELEGGALQRFNKGIFSGESNGFEPFFAGQLETCGHAVRQWKGFEIYGEKILKLVPAVMRHGREVFRSKPDHFKTLIHADLWVNNAMFRYHDENHPSDVILLDFQFSCWSSPAIDLHYFFNTSLDFNTRIHREEDLFQYYYQHLTDTLSSLRFQGIVPSLQELWSQYLRNGFYAMTSACIILPLVLNEAVIDHSSLMKNDKDLLRDKLKVYDQPKIQKFLKVLLPVFDRRGYLDSPR